MAPARGLSMVERLLYTIPSADRCFLLPEGLEPAAGNLRLGGLGDEERRVDPSAVALYEVSQEEAQAHIRRQVEGASTGVTAALTGLLGGLGESPDPHQLAERLGLTGGDRQAIETALRGVAADVRAVATAIASGQSADLDAARKRLERRGLDLGDALDNLAHQLDAIRGITRQEGSTVVPGGLQGFIDSVLGDSEEPVGRRIDDMLARFLNELGPVFGPDPECDRDRRQREYQRDARTAIADSLREAGITPLNDLQ